MKSKKVFIAGSTGSIGVNVLQCLAHLNAESSAESPVCYQVVGLAAGRNVSLLAQQIKELQTIQTAPLEAAVVSSIDDQTYRQLVRDFPKIKFYRDVAEAITSCSFDLLVNGIVGSAGLKPTVVALQKKCDVALANKESLVMAGDLVMKLAVDNRCALLPIDSEHSAIFSLLSDKTEAYLKKIILTASGGPFFKNKIKHPTVEQALSHPTWTMGAKISIDSATMMNKSLEVIEAHHLFGVAYDDIEVIIHPQSVVHSLIETVDGELYAKLGHSDMRQPIQNALTYPTLRKNALQRFELWKVETLNFYPFDHQQFPVLKMSIECGKRGGSAPVVLNAANEALVKLFLEKKITFAEIITSLETELVEHSVKQDLTLAEILELDVEVKAKINKNFSK